MNKVMLLGRLVKPPELRYSQAAEPIAVLHFSLAVDRRYKRANEPTADFIDCVAFGKTAEFINKYFAKGNRIGVVGSIRVSSWDKDGQRHWRTEVVVDESYFAESKQASPAADSKQASPAADSSAYFEGAPELDDEDLPF